jgi:Sec7-like guanine-nucleotide exchange factor
MQNEIEVFLTEIVISTLEDRKSHPWYQRYTLLKHLRSIFSDNNNGGLYLAELYLNYDCNIGKENIWEKLISSCAKLTSFSLSATPNSSSTHHLLSFYKQKGKSLLLTTGNLLYMNKEQVEEMLSPKGDIHTIRKEGAQFLLEGCIKPLWLWCENSQQEKQEKLSTIDEENVNVDDPNTIVGLKQQKQSFAEGVKKFNSHPKKVAFELIKGNEVFD